MDDATLDEFAADGEPDDADAGGAPEDAREEVDDGTGAAGPADVEPAVSTFAWAPEGAACAACGAVVEERWRRAAGLVCVDCLCWEQSTE